MPKTPLERYQDKVKEGSLQPDRDQEAAARELQRLYDELTSSRHPGEGRDLLKLIAKIPAFAGMTSSVKGIYLWGGVGRGKSMLMDMFFECLPDTIPKRRVHFHEFMIETHDFLHRARQEGGGEAAILKLAKKVAGEARILCFDEFHVTDIADAMILGRLFTHIFKHGTTMVATSNWPPDKLYEGGLQRDLFLPFISLVKEKLVIAEVNGGTDYRLQCLADTGVYFAPLGPASRRHAEETFRRLVDGASPYKETLTVKGRNIEVPAVARGVARFTFSQLCERPMGAEDYLMIAQNYHTVFLEGVPRLKYDRRNEAKRLMTLIDALYDQKTKLVVTADAPPEELYRGDDHGFEFQRTVSRLIEMQSVEYLGREHA